MISDSVLFDLKLFLECMPSRWLVPPVDIRRFYSLFRIRCFSDSELFEEGMTKQDIFNTVRNNDGGILYDPSSGIHTVIYNDRCAETRQRFTMAEELMHFILYHTRQPGFGVSNPDFDEEVYARFEEEAKTCAGFVLCPPDYYNRHRRMRTSALAAACGISEACAARVVDNYGLYGDALNKPLII